MHFYCIHHSNGTHYTILIGNLSNQLLLNFWRSSSRNNKDPFPEIFGYIEIVLFRFLYDVDVWMLYTEHTFKRDQATQAVPLYNRLWLQTPPKHHLRNEN